MDPELIAFYLPQYHPIPENDRWWGQGFTDWRNVVTARPLFRGHYQPHIPADLGFYDLRLPETRSAQAHLAREHGISGFCYYHYWFGGRRVLERPFGEVLRLRQPDFPFCLCWANENWTRTWDGLEKEILLQQQYSDQDDLAHIRWLIDVFKDPRYIRIEGKPLFLIYRISSLPNARRSLNLWHQEIARAGFPGAFFCRVESNFPGESGDPAIFGCDAAVEFQPNKHTFAAASARRPLIRRVQRKARDLVSASRAGVWLYRDVVEAAINAPRDSYRRFPCVSPSWDNSPRRKSGSIIIHKATPELYHHWLIETIKRERRAPFKSIIFINAWNEWAEGSHLEPCLRWGTSYLEATAAASCKTTNK